jgi:predicted phage terminase large subunit-like protein
VVNEKFARWWSEKRQRARTDLLFLCNEILGYKDVEAEMHGPVIDKIQKFRGGVDKFNSSGQWLYEPACEIWDLEGPRNQLFLDPRGTLKTSLITQAQTVQWIINFPNVRILIDCAIEKQVNKVITGIRSHFQFGERFRFFFPEFCPTAKKAADFGNQEGFTTPARRDHTLRETTVSSATVGRKIAGSHYEVIFHSDLVDENNVKTAAQMEEVINHFKYSDPLLDRNPKPPGYGWTIIEGTPYDFGDLHELIQKEERERIAAGQEPQWSISVRGGIKEDGTALWPKRLPLQELERIRLKLGDFIYSCFGAGTKILMSDFSDKPIEDIGVGDEVVGYELNQAKLVKTRVLALNSKVAEVVKVQLASGMSFVVTPDHKFWNRRTEERRSPYSKLHLGSEVSRVYSPSFHSAAREWDWLSGILDGEGSCTGSITIAQSAEHNPEVSQEIERVLTLLGFNYKTYYRKARPGHKGSNLYVIGGGRAEKIRLLQNCRLAKKWRIEQSIWAHPKRLSESLDRVVKITPLGMATVYNFQTESGNYIAEGIATKNCQYLCKPVPSSGSLATREQIKFIPRSAINAILPMLRLHVTVDLHGMEDKASHDYTVITLAGFDRDGRVYVLECYRGHYTPFETIERIFLIYERYPQLFDIKIEKDAHARVLLPFLRREMGKRQRFPNIIPIPRSTTISKVQRIRGLQPWFAGGVIKFADDLGCRLELLEEILKFPSYPHDDILDTIADQMQNRDGLAIGDVMPNMPKQVPEEFKHPAFDRFMGFDPTTHGQNWFKDYWQGGNFYHKGTGL